MLCEAAFALPKEAIKIGVIAPLTGSDPPMGEDVVKMTEVMRPWLDARSQIYNYQFVVDDGRCGLGSTATTIAAKFIGLDKSKFLLATCSGEALQAGALAQKEGVLIFAVASAHPDVKKMGDYVFRTYIDIEDSLQRFADYMQKHVDGGVALLSEEAVVTMGIKKVLLARLGGKIVFAADSPPESEDFATLLARVKSSGAKALYLNAASDKTLASMVNRAREQKLDIRMFSYFFPETPGFLQVAGANAAGLEFIGLPEPSAASPEFNRLYQEFQAKYGRKSNREFAVRTTFDALKSMTDGIEAVGPDPARVKEYLKTYKGQGAWGEISYDENGDIRNLHFVLKRLKANGTSETIDALQE